MKASKQSASVAHNIVWFCKVESVVQEDARKVILPVVENLPTIVLQLAEVVLSGAVMEKSQRDFFETETSFFEKITAISSLLKPSQSKDEKRAIIKQKLIEYN